MLSPAHEHEASGAAHAPGTGWAGARGIQCGAGGTPGYLVHRAGGPPDRLSPGPVSLSLVSIPCRRCEGASHKWEPMADLMGLRGLATPTEVSLVCQGIQGSIGSSRALVTRDIHVLSITEGEAKWK